MEHLNPASNTSADGPGEDQCLTIQCREESSHELEDQERNASRKKNVCGVAAALIITSMFFYMMFVSHHFASAEEYSTPDGKRKIIDNIMQHRTWEKVDLGPLQPYLMRLDDQCGREREGDSSSFEEEQKLYTSVASLPWIQTICEIGFNMGHSAALWLSANPQARVIMFDIWQHGYSKCGESILLQTFGPRLEIHKGDSTYIVPQFRQEYPNVHCDIVVVDGGHSYFNAMTDMTNMHSLAKDGALMLVDDTQYGDVRKAIAEQLHWGSIRRVGTVARNDGREVMLFQIEKAMVPVAGLLEQAVVKPDSALPKTILSV